MEELRMKERRPKKELVVTMKELNNLLWSIDSCYDDVTNKKLDESQSLSDTLLVLAKESGLDL